MLFQKKNVKFFFLEKNCTQYIQNLKKNEKKSSTYKFKPINVSEWSLNYQPDLSYNFKYDIFGHIKRPFRKEQF